MCLERCLPWLRRQAEAPNKYVRFGTLKSHDDEAILRGQQEDDSDDESKERFIQPRAGAYASLASRDAPLDGQSAFLSDAMHDVPLAS
eukprot:m.22312 g.22312  ORF g.22312 m.22312 type:complete len:88 (-) comp3734_c0_seq1:161-424(-)